MFGHANEKIFILFSQFEFCLFPVSSSEYKLFMINSQTARIKFRFNMNWQMGIDPKKIFKRALNWQLLLKIFENSPYKEFIDQGNGSKRALL